MGGVGHVAELSPLSMLGLNTWYRRIVHLFVSSNIMAGLPTWRGHKLMRFSCINMLDSSPKKMDSRSGRDTNVAISEVAVGPGEWKTPASPQISLAMTLKPTSAVRVQPIAQYLKHIPAGNISICRLNDSQVFEFATEAAFGYITLNEDLFAPVLQDSGIKRMELIALDILEDATLRQMATILLQQKRDRFRDGNLFLDSIATALSSYLVARYSSTLPLNVPLTGGLAPSTLRRCIDFIQANLSGSIRLDDLARESGMSASHLIRSFRQSTGKSPYQYVLELRTMRAKSMMRDRRLGLTEIALSSGFANQHHLSRIFRKVVGIAPSRYRANLTA
jgi:AraC family transcriptional regulator